MKRILFSALFAVCAHALLLSADFNRPRNSTSATEIPERLTVVMVPAPLPARKPLPAPPPPPAPELMRSADVAAVPADLPKEIPLPARAAPPVKPGPKVSLKARTHDPRIQPPQTASKRPPPVPPRVQASMQTPVADTPRRPAAPPASAEKPRRKLVSAAAVHQPRRFVPDRPAIPLLKQNPPPVYPKSARRRGYQGSVVLKVLVAADGRAEVVELDRSCGYEILDRTALTAVQGWQFDPGIKDGKKTKMWVKVPVRFELK